MANELNIVLTASGETVTCQPYAAGTASGSPITLTEIGTSGVYTGDMTGSAGTYLLVFNDGTENVGVGSIVWSGTAEVPVSTLTTGDLPSVPTAEANATAVRTELTEISNLDASVSSRLAAADYAAPTNAPTAAAVASAVRTELTELSNLDASVSSRLAGSAYTAPANSDVAAVKAVTDALVVERLNNCATTAIVGNLLAHANS
jgi:hypothetical protein